MGKLGHSSINQDCLLLSWATYNSAFALCIENQSPTMRWSHIRDNHVYIDSVNSKNNNNNSMWNCPAIFGSENHTYQFGKSPTKRSSQSHTALKDMSMHNLNYLCGIKNSKKIDNNFAIIQVGFYFQSFWALLCGAD